MIVSEKQIIENTLSVGYWGNDLLRLTKDGDLMLKEEAVDHAVEQFKVWDDTLLYKTKEALIIFNRKTKQRIEGVFYLSHAWTDETRCILLKEEGDTDAYYELSRTFEIQRLSFHNSFVKKFYKNHAFCLEGDVLSAYSTDGQEIWKYTLNDLLSGSNATISGDLLPLGDKLFFYWYDTSSRTHGTACVGISTGKLLKNSHEMFGWLMLRNDKLFATDRKQILIMDANSFDVQTINLEDQLSSSPNLAANKFSITGDLFFFSGDKSSYVGIIDLKNQTVLWRKELDPEKNTFNRQLITFDNKFCVVDARNVLYQFEYEK